MCECKRNMDADINKKIQTIKNHLKSYPDFPKPGILFWDIFSVLQQPDVFDTLRDVLVHTAKSIEPPVECITALDARGFLFGPLIALELKVPFVPIRKRGKLPGTIKSTSYALEYGQDTIEMQAGSIQQGQKVLIVDDLLATGGTLGAACDLVKSVGGEVVICLVIIELASLSGRAKVAAPVKSLINL